MRNSIVYATGSYLPERIVLNDELTQFPSSSLHLIEQKTGVRSRRRAAEEESTSDLAVNAARNCLDKAGVPAEEIDGIVVSTSSPDRMQPATATRVQHMLGATKAFAFDINSVCSGSTFGLSIADSFIKSDKYETILLVAAEVYSKILNQKDFSTYPYFGDGSGAVLLKAADSPSRGVLHSHLKTDGSMSDVICVPGGGTMLPFSKMSDPSLAFFRMKGKTVFDFAVHQGAAIIGELLGEAGVSVKDIRCFLCHQANINILRNIAEKIEAPIEKFFVNLDRYGNTASASVLIALDEAMSEGILLKGDLVVTVAFGGGLSWGANLIRI